MTAEFEPVNRTGTYVGAASGGLALALAGIGVFLFRKKSLKLKAEELANRERLAIEEKARYENLKYQLEVGLA